MLIVDRFLRAGALTRLGCTIPAVSIRYVRPEKWSCFSTFAKRTVDEIEEEDSDHALNVNSSRRGELPKIREREVDNFGRAYATGRRKTSVARVWIKEGCGEITVNQKDFADTFMADSREHVLEPFIVSKTSGFFDVWCTTKGGGHMGKYVGVYMLYYFSLCNGRPSWSS